MANRFGNSDDPNDPYHQRYLDRITNSKNNTHKIITRSSDKMSSTSRKKQRRTETTPCGKNEKKRRASSAVTPNSSDEMKMNKEFTNVQHKDNKEVEYIKTRNSSDTNKSKSEFDHLIISWNNYKKCLYQSTIIPVAVVETHKSIVMSVCLVSI